MTVQEEKKEVIKCLFINNASDIPPYQWDEALSRLTDSEKERVHSYVFRKDQERSLLSYLLQRRVISQYLFDIIDRNDKEKSSLTLSIKDSYRISRTKENKPYLEILSPKLAKLLPRNNTFNYNVSHHGDYIGIISNIKCLVGIDIVDVSTRASWVKSLREYVDIYKKQLSSNEIIYILDADSEEKGYTRFYILWGLKEAYIKAVGVGMGISLREAEFNVSPSDDVSGHANLRLRGNTQSEWQFKYFYVDDKHLAVVAIGPPSAALQSYRTVAWPNFESSEDFKNNSICFHLELEISHTNCDDLLRF